MKKSLSLLALVLSGGCSSTPIYDPNSPMPQNHWTDKWDPAKALNMSPAEYRIHVDEQLEEFTIKTKTSLEIYNKLSSTGHYIFDGFSLSPLNQYRLETLQKKACSLENKVNVFEARLRKCILECDELGINANSFHVRDLYASIEKIQKKLVGYWRPDVSEEKIVKAREVYLKNEVLRQNYQLEVERMERERRIGD